MVWFLVLSLVPMMFVTGYSLVKYEQAIDNELVQRLRSNSREFTATISDYEIYLANRRARYRADSTLGYFLLTNSIPQAKTHLRGILVNSSVTSLSLFNREGQLITSMSPNDVLRSQDSSSSDEARGLRREGEESDVASVFLSDNYKDQLNRDGQYLVVDAGPKNSLDLVSISKVETKNGRLAGYVEEIINVGVPFLNSMKKRLNLEIVIFDSRSHLVAGSHDDFSLYQRDYFVNTIDANSETFFDLSIRNELFGFITTPIKWGTNGFTIGLGASKQKSRAVLKNVNLAFFTMICAIGVLLIFTSIVATRVIVRPVYEMVDAIQKMEMTDAPISIPVSTDTELGLLTMTFNEMSRRMYQARSDLEKKIKELEGAYFELKETQTRLVQSAKMASLGQLVAGVAHELNNPIGFIYSNMGHLRDYSQRLMSVIEAAEKSPDDLARAKAEVDFQYIVQDLPRLIASCEEGARRTRDIVIGLRNFSRLDEALIKKVDLKEGINNTLRLLSGEMKNRIRVHADFAAVPPVTCYASQLNQVFMNILANAAQAIVGEGEVWIKLRHLQEKGQTERALVSIKDSGPGMPADVVEKIFDPFFTTKGVGQGTGLGLSISYGIVKKHGGEIQVLSAPGKGTEFIITVPIDGPPVVVEKTTPA